MTGLLEIREKIKLIYSKGEVFILPVVKFLLAYIVLSTVNNRLGYMPQVTNVAIVLILSLMCSFLSVGCLVFFAAIFSLAHMFALSIEVALVGLCVYLILYLLYFRFSPRDSLLVVLTPLLFGWNIPYVIPLAVGLLCGPASAISVACGVVVYNVNEAVATNASNIKTMGDEDAVGKIRLMIDSLIKNKAMLVLIVVFTLTILVVYLLRRLSVNYAWTIAMVAGAMTLVMALLIGDLLYDTNISVGATLLGSLLGLLVCKVIEFFRFCVDYNRTERVQFEDDEYYYYVKAVPKMMVAKPAKTVKRINAQQSSGVEGDYGAARTSERTVVMERTGDSRKALAQRAVRGEYRTGRSVTVGSAEAASDSANGNADNNSADDYEELF